MVLIWVCTCIPHLIATTPTPHPIHTFDCYLNININDAWLYKSMHLCCHAELWKFWHNHSERLNTQSFCQSGHSHLSPPQPHSPKLGVEGSNPTRIDVILLSQVEIKTSLSLSLSLSLSISWTLLAQMRPPPPSFPQVIQCIQLYSTVLRNSTHVIICL